MQILIYGLSVALISIAVNYLKMSVINEQIKAKNAKQVRLPKSYFWIGLSGFVLFSSPFPISYFFPTLISGWSLTIGILFIPFQLLGLSIVLGYLNCRIDIFDNTFVYHTFLGKKYEFKYTDIVYFRQTKNVTHIYTKTKHLYMDISMIGDDAFLLKYDEVMRKTPHDREIQRIKDWEIQRK